MESEAQITEDNMSKISSENSSKHQGKKNLYKRGKITISAFFTREGAYTPLSGVRQYHQNL